MSRLLVLPTVRPYALVIAAAAINAALDLEPGLARDIVITSGTDGHHMTGSKHRGGGALDFRIHGFPGSVLTHWIDGVKLRLGPDYQCLIEHLGEPNEHLHVERDPP